MRSSMPFLSQFFRLCYSVAILVTFILNTLSPLPQAYADPAFGGTNEFVLPSPGVRIDLSPDFAPAELKGITIHPENPLMFDFIIYKGDQFIRHPERSEGSLIEQQLKKNEYTKLIKYFLASLAIPDEDQWVNLSPYEKDRIIKDDFGKTMMGRDLLAQDYILKQITASLIYPEEGLGKKFWEEVYTKAQKQYGTTNIPVNTFNKVWIIPDDALIYEKGNTAYVLKNHLKVMLEQDYLALNRKNVGVGSKPTQERAGYEPAPTNINQLGSQIIRELVLPALEKEVNQGKNFALLRQVYSGMLLAAWFKRTLRASLLGQIYADKSKIKGINQDPATNEAIYQRYLQAYKKGVFNYIKEDVDKYTNEPIPRKYFSGGLEHYKTSSIRGTRTLNSANKGLLAIQGPEEDLAQVTLQKMAAMNPAMASDVPQDRIRIIMARQDYETAFVGYYGPLITRKGSLIAFNRWHALYLARRELARILLATSPRLSMQQILSYFNYKRFGIDVSRFRIVEDLLIKATLIVASKKQRKVDQEDQRITDFVQQADDFRTKRDAERAMVSNYQLRQEGRRITLWDIKNNHSVGDQIDLPDFLNIASMKMEKVFNIVKDGKLITIVLLASGDGNTLRVLFFGGEGQNGATPLLSVPGARAGQSLITLQQDGKYFLNINYVLSNGATPKEGFATISVQNPNDAHLYMDQWPTLGPGFGNAAVHSIQENLHQGERILYAFPIAIAGAPSTLAIIDPSPSSDLDPTVPINQRETSIRFVVVRGARHASSRNYIIKGAINDVHVISDGDGRTNVDFPGSRHHITLSLTNIFPNLDGYTLNGHGGVLQFLRYLVTHLNGQRLTIDTEGLESNPSYSGSLGDVSFDGQVRLDDFNFVSTKGEVVGTQGHTFPASDIVRISDGSEVLWQKSPSPAMLVHDKAMANIPGGIDLNSANLAMIIKRDGRGMVLPLSQQDMAQLGNFEGLDPVILSITPASQTSLFAQLQSNP